jgi:hypothetical protein
MISRRILLKTVASGLTLGFYVEPQFSLVSPNIIYGAVTGGNYRTISQYDFQTGAYLPLVDVMTFYLAAPIYVTAISALFLRANVTKSDGPTLA